ncbi:MAG: ATP-binding protein [Sulfolobus sp.]
MLKKHIIIFTLIFLECVLSQYVPLPSYFGINEIIILNAIAGIDAVLFYSLTGSTVLTIVYYPAIILAYSIVTNQLDESSIIFFLSVTVLTYFGIAVLASLLNWIVRREISDSWIDQISTYEFSFSPTGLIISILLSITVFILLFKNYFIFTGALVSGIAVSLFNDYSYSPLVLLSWFSLPYLLSPKIHNLKGSVCIGKIRAVLGRGSILEQNNIKLTPPSKYKWLTINSDFCIDFQKVKNYNIVIIGTSGSGKSTMAKILINRLKVSYLIFDLHGEYFSNTAKRVSMGSFSVNPLSLFGKSPRERALEISYMLKSIFNLGNIQSIELTNLLLEAYLERGIDPDDTRSWNNQPPTFRDVLMLLEKKKRSALTSQEISKYESLEPYLLFLSSSIFMGNNLNLEEIINGNYILDFSMLPTSEVKYIIIETILRSIQSFMYRVQKSDSLRKLIIIDEAPFILSKDSGKELLERLFAEGRKFGFGFVLISQSIEYVKDLIPNSGLFFSFNVVEPRELDYISKFFGGSDQNVYKAIYETLPQLLRGYCLTRDLLGRHIYLVQLDKGDTNGV